MAATSQQDTQALPIDALGWPRALADQAVGKRVGGALYVHASALVPSTYALVQRALALVAAAQRSPSAQNPPATGALDELTTVCKFQDREPVVSLLLYPGFWTQGFPQLAAAWTVDLSAASVSQRSYDPAANPPILHRKEQMIAADHPQHGPFARLTAQAEAAQLFADQAIIGHALAWQEELAARGLCVQGHQLVAADVAADPRDWRAERHRTALVRSGLSSPVQVLWRAGLLGAHTRFFDYGCGRGDDVALLSDRGIDASGWDPWFAPQRPRSPADAVNLGFVLNVIEDLRERREALLGAWSLTGKVLSVAALIGGRTAQDRWRLYQDGVLTSRGTFQKYYSHTELGSYIAEVLGREPVPAQPGVWLVFRRDEDEQDFLAARQQSRPPLPRRPKPDRPLATRADKAPRERQPRPIRPSKWLEHAALAEGLWHATLTLGRLPEADEWSDLPALQQHLGRAETVLRHLEQERDPADLQAARDQRMGDLSAWLGLQLFERRRSFAHLSPRLQRDVRAFWGSHAKAVEAGRELLFASGKLDQIASACERASGLGLGHLQREPDGRVDSLHLRGELIDRLEPLLRVYVGCAERLYGDLRAADVVKLHARSPKITAQNFDDFAGRRVPDLLERVKIDLRRGEFEVFGYGTEQYPAQPLWLKARLLAPEDPDCVAQKAFDDGLLALGVFDFSGFGPPRAEVEALVGTL
jgi:DNA phosphorothioation-associated putative methyltransferase